MIRQRIFNNNYYSNSYLNSRSYRSGTKSWFLTAHLTIILCLLVWFSPLTSHWCKQLDAQFFLRLNETLLWSPSWQALWGWLNHPNETWLNLVVMVTLNFCGIFLLPAKQRTHGLAMVLYYWAFFQLGLLATHGIFTDLLAIQRASPSLILTPIVKLSSVLGMPIKDFSENCFPAGHTFVAIYWAAFTSMYAPKLIKTIAWCLVPFLVLPRLFSGAHWLSDVLFTIPLAYALLAWAKAMMGMVSKNFIVKQI